MTDTEAKALAHSLRSRAKYYRSRSDMDAIMDAGLMGQAADYIEATEARHAEEMRELKERFSVVAAKAIDDGVDEWIYDLLSPFIIPAPDPLVEAISGCGWLNSESMAEQLRAAMQARGYEWRKIGEAGNDSPHITP